MLTLAAVFLVCITALLLQREHLEYLREARGKAPEMPARNEPMPADLKLLVRNESEPWAREQARQALEESYMRHGDWNRVREEALITTGATNG